MHVPTTLAVGEQQRITQCEIGWMELGDPLQSVGPYLLDDDISSFRAIIFASARHDDRNFLCSRAIVATMVV